MCMSQPMPTQLLNSARKLLYSEIVEAMYQNLTGMPHWESSLFAKMEKQKRRSGAVTGMHGDQTLLVSSSGRRTLLEQPPASILPTVLTLTPAEYVRSSGNSKVPSA